MESKEKKLLLDVEQGKECIELLDMAVGRRHDGQGATFGDPGGDRLGLSRGEVGNFIQEQEVEGRLIA